MSTRAAPIEAPTLSDDARAAIDTPARRRRPRSDGRGDRPDGARDGASAGSRCGRTPRPTRALAVGRRQLDAGAVGSDGRHDRRGRGLRRRWRRRPVHRLPAGAARSEGGASPGARGALPAAARRRLGRSGSGRIADALGAERDRVGLVVEIDSGGRRSGVAPAGAGAVGRAATDLGLTVIGVFTHGGHGYAGPDSRSDAADDEVRSLTAAAASLRAGRHRSRRSQRRLDPDGDRFRARRRHRGAARDVRVRRPPAGRPRGDRAGCGRRGRRRTVVSVNAAERPVRGRRRRQDPRQGRGRLHRRGTARSRSWTGPSSPASPTTTGRRRRSGCRAAGCRAGRHGRAEPHLPGRELRRHVPGRPRRRRRRHVAGGRPRTERLRTSR